MNELSLELEMSILQLLNWTEFKNSSLALITYLMAGFE